jgi:hypothetical protein
MPYMGSRGVGVYDPIDTKKAQWSGSLVGMDRGNEMAKAHEHLDRQDEEGRQEYHQNRAQATWQAAHERNLQASEAQRRQYDSETARMGQDKKYGLLGGLLRGF